MRALNPDRPARHRNCILFCADATFFRYAVVAIERIRDLAPDLEADICLVADRPIELPSTLHYLDIRCFALEVDRQGLDFPVSDVIPFAAYLRFFAIEALASDYKKILYLDADVLPDRPEIADIFDVALRDGTVLAAVRDLAQFRSPKARLPEMDSLNLPTFQYFNSGVLLVDTKKWVADRMLASILNVVRQSPQALYWHDQSALNIVLQGNWTELTHHWRWMVDPKLVFALRWDHPVLIHFAGRQKPWSDMLTWLPRRIVSYYDDRLEQHFGVTPPRRDNTNGRRKSVLSMAFGAMKRLRPLLKRRATHPDLWGTKDPNK